MNRRSGIKLWIVLSCAFIWGVCDGVARGQSLPQVLAQAASSDEAERKAALSRLSKRSYTAEEGIALLRAAAALPEVAKKTDGDDTCYAMLICLERHPSPHYVAVIEENYKSFSHDGREECQDLLEALNSQEAAAAVVRLVNRYSKSGMLDQIRLHGWRSKGEFAEVLFPALLEHLKTASIADDVYSFVLSYCENGHLSGAQLAPYLEGVITHGNQLAERLRPRQQDKGVAWMYARDYQADREGLAILIDVAGYMPADERLDSSIRSWTKLTDPRIKMFSIQSLLKHRREVRGEDVKAVAADLEMRNWLYRSMQKLGRTDLFPAEYRTQKAFAESEMVYWLLYPTELGRAPDEIELMKVVPMKDGLRTLDYYVFRFRTLKPDHFAEDGWMAGIAGPYRLEEEPTTHNLGDTFSCFEKWDSRTAEGHLQYRLELNQKQNRRQNRSQ